MSPFTRRVGLAGWALGPVLVLPALIRFLATDYNEFLIFNADLLMIPAVFDDLQRGGSLRSWHLPSAPYFAPDFVLYAIARVLPNYFLDAAAFMVLQLSGAWFVWRWLVGVITEHRDRWGAIIGFAWFMLFVTAQARPLAYGLASFIHFGTFVLALWALGLTIRALRDDSQRALVVFGLVSTVTLISDRWFAVWFLAPAGLAVAGWALRRADVRPAARRWALLAGASLGLSLLVHRFVLVHDNLSSVAVEFRGLGLLADGWAVIVDEARLSPWTLITVTACLLATIVALCSPRLRPTGISEDMARLLAIFLGTTPVLIIVAQLGMSTTPDIRYYLPAYALPLLLVGLLASRVRPRAQWILLAVPVLFTLGPAADAISNVGTTRNDQAPCVDQALSVTGSRRGISTYWDAKPITVASDLELTIATVSPDLSLDPVNSSAAHYGQPYDFAVMSTWADPYTLEPAGVVPQAGEPLAITRCGLYTIYDYGPGGLSWIVVPKAG